MGMEASNVEKSGSLSSGVSVETDGVQCDESTLAKGFPQQ